MTGKLCFEDGTVVDGRPGGFAQSTAGEVVFTTGMVGYPESLTDPSYEGQILIFTYPLIGNYGVPRKSSWESNRIHVAGIVVSFANPTPSHWSSNLTFDAWLKLQKIPMLEIPDTRFLTQHIRTHGTRLGKIVIGKKDIPFHDPNTENLVARVSTSRVKRYLVRGATKTVVLIDCGAKANVLRCLLKRQINVVVVPWNTSLAMIKKSAKKLDGIVISNGPGDPMQAKETIDTIREILEMNIPILGICLGHQLLTLAAGGKTIKLKFGHRSQNQPCTLFETNRCYITTQNHGYVVDTIPPGFKPWFTNANDGTNEGIIHAKKPILSVQFHPEANPGPTDTEWVFDLFLEKLR
ncbi:MAG: glutamine-hydrolyzing carbamoyl-phosphate synthase small subunit [bacterium]|nr:glutamine-hydrolyzing carbamoyl-phosphate synthase small subunit [bacterium]